MVLRLLTACTADPFLRGVILWNAFLAKVAFFQAFLHFIPSKIAKVVRGAMRGARPWFGTHDLISMVFRQARARHSCASRCRLGTAPRRGTVEKEDRWNVESRRGGDSLSPFDGAGIDAVNLPPVIHPRGVGHVC